MRVPSWIVSKPILNIELAKKPHLSYNLDKPSERGQ
jgi:hypothetical protein